MFVEIKKGNYTNLGDGFCDTACNVESCGFDLGDCKDSPPSPSKEAKSS